MAVFEIDGNYLINFNVDYESNTQKVIDPTPYLYTVYGAPEEEVTEEGAVEGEATEEAAE